jgi:hypothetical protein
VPQSVVLEAMMIAGGVVLLSKPYRKTELARKIREVLDGERAH